MCANAAPSQASELPKQFEHQTTAKRCLDLWQRLGLFNAEVNTTKRPFAIVIPPPNVTGALHLGHALNNTLQDVLIRWRRMSGDAVLWMPGTDHAGIATQAVVERRLREDEGKSRHDLGREGLVKRIWAWKDQYETRILSQLREMGASCDWRRTRFTLDAICARAVRHTFFNLFRDRLIYRGKRLVNWDVFLQTAISDDEVEYKTLAGSFWYFQYPVVSPKPGEPAFVTIATTRPETMLGDTAVAVHPDPARALDQVARELRQKLAESAEKDRAAVEKQIADLEERKQSMLPSLIQLRDMARDGRRVLLPLSQREIPLVTDEWAKPELGTGCVKITPAHDPNDYEVGKRQNLPMVNVLNPDGAFNSEAGPYQGLSIAETRKRVIADMEAKGLLARVEDRDIETAHSQRSGVPIEPYLADQWFVRMNELAQSAMDAVTSKQVEIFPNRYERGYLDWLKEKRDWPVSRQLWWGHRIPIWYCDAEDESQLIAAFANRNDVTWRRDEEKSQWLICSLEEDLPSGPFNGLTLRQDDDVLDTWFSSALWPHSTLGWPDKTPELEYFYPTSTLITSRDIITLWVARMVLTGIYNVGKPPFREVFIHPKILDGYGETMSKSKGNGVDPLDVIQKFGADSLRYALAYLCTDTQDVRMPVDFECPACSALVAQTKENRMLPKIKCGECGKSFSTQWAKKPDDAALPRGLVISEKFSLARNFCNKLWNAARFVMMNLDGYTTGKIHESSLQIEDRWLLSRLNSVIESVTNALHEYRYADAARSLYDFSWDEYCSFYLEISKDRLQNTESRAQVQRLLTNVLDELLRLLHPFVPFITEEIWAHLSQFAPVRGWEQGAAAPESVMQAPWPTAQKRWIDSAVERRFADFQAALKGLREIRSRQNIQPKTQLDFVMRAEQRMADDAQGMAAYFLSMAGCRLVSAGPDVTPPPLAASFVFSGAELHVNLAGHIDVQAEIVKKEKELAKLKGLIEAKDKKLSNESFVSRAPVDVVTKEKESLAEMRGQLEAIETSLTGLRAASSP